SPNRVPRAAQFGCDPLRSPSKRLQPNHRRDIVRRLHRVPPQIVHPQSFLPFRHNPTLLVSSGDQFVVSPDTTELYIAKNDAHDHLACTGEAGFVQGTTVENLDVETLTS